MARRIRLELLGRVLVPGKTSRLDKRLLNDEQAGTDVLAWYVFGVTVGMSVQ